MGVLGMPFYLRKSVSAGPFRFNFSKSGMGVSVGVKGLRIGTGPRGHYVHAGRGGLHYRASVGRAGQKKSLPAVAEAERSKEDFIADDVVLTDIESGDVLAMQEEGFSDLLAEINAARRKADLALLGAVLPGVAGVLLALFVVPQGLFVSLLFLPGWALGRWLNSYLRTAVVFYELESDVTAAYQTVAERFDMLLGCAAAWHVEAGGAVRDLATWKRNAGATHIVRKKTTTLAYKLPACLASNVTPPALHVGKQVLYFLPDVVLVDDGANVGAIGYPDLGVASQRSNFIEEGTVPHDAKVISRTWKHPNKSGGPDRRFKDNYQIPVCEYEVMHMTSNSGLNELVEFSRTGVVTPFSQALKAMPKNRILHEDS